MDSAIGVPVADLETPMLNGGSQFGALMAVMRPFTIGFTVFILIENIFLLVIMIHRMKNTTSPEIRTIFRKMLFSIAIGTLGILIYTPNSWNPISNYTVIGDILSKLCYLASFSMIFYLIKKNGILVFQDQGLRRLIIVDSFGLIHYSYEFRAFTNRKTSNADEMLFSGAINAISKIMQEFTGTTESQIRQIELNGLQIMIRPIGNTIYSAILFVDHPTQFFSEALAGVSQKFAKELSNHQSHEYIKGKTAENMQISIRQQFNDLLLTGSTNKMVIDK